MDPKLLQSYFDNPETAETWMREIGIADYRRGIRNLVGIAWNDPTLEITAPFIDQLSPLLRWTADPDMVLNNLERFFKATRSPKTLVSLFLQDRMALPMLLEIFATSQYLGDMLIGEPELFETVRQGDGLPKSQRQLTDELVAEVQSLEKDSSVLRALRRFKRRQTLRIAFGDIIKKQSLEVVTNQISRVAEAILEAAIRAAGRKLYQKHGTPLSEEGRMAHFVVIALGKLGGRELNYSSDIDLMFLYDREGKTDPVDDSIDNSQYFSELGREIVRFLGETTELGAAYRVDMRLRPHGRHGSLAIGLDEALRYYDLRGRTWERQAFIKARPVAGNIQLGSDFLKRLEPWIYRRNLMQADIAGIRALKRSIERNAKASGDELLNVKTGYGGIRDIEFLTQFLQLLHGGELSELRIGNTLKAIDRLEQTGCLQRQERDLLSEGYRFLRKIEHRLQIMFDLQTHTMPDQPAELRKLALRMGYHDMSGLLAENAFDADFHYITNADRRMLNHVLINAFQDEETAAEVDLLLDPEPDEGRIRSVLEKYHFEDSMKAFKYLNDLMDEKNPYLSARRCRHFLVAIAPKLLQEIAETPSPDRTLATLTTVSDALGEKGGLWELFSFSAPSLTLFVKLCAYAPFLTDMLCRDPGMLDGLMDSLVLDRIPSLEMLDHSLSLLCDNAEQMEPILSGFKNDRVLPVGTRNLLGRSSIRETTAAISDIAQVCLKQVVLSEYHRLARKHGTPALYDSPGTVSDSNVFVLPNLERFVPCRFAVVALGRFGGREMDYQSDLDLIFLFEKDGKTSPVRLEKSEGFQWEDAEMEILDNRTFFNLLAQGVVKRMSQFGSWGKLYNVDLRLRPMGKSGSLATSLEGLLDYFYDGTGELWERQMLCKARVVFSSDFFKHEAGDQPRFARTVMKAIRRVQYGMPLEGNWKEQIRQMRQRMLKSSTQDQLKRASGGVVDMVFVVKRIQLKHVKARPGINVPNTFNALERLYAAGILDESDYRILRDAYHFFRSVASFLCLMNAPSTKQLPEEEGELKKLAFLTGAESSEELVARFEESRRQVADCFDRLFS